MKRLSILLLSALCIAATTFAYDFQSGILYYNITSENTVEVTYFIDSEGENSYKTRGKVNIPASVTYDGTTYSVTCIGDSAFMGCWNLSTVTIRNSVTSIGDYAFFDCDLLTSITIPESVTSIGNYAFCSCSFLSSITIPNSVTSIGDEAFFGSGLLDITCLAVTPPICGNNAFEDFVTLWCPCESKEAYQSADGWSLFNDIRRIDFPQTTLLSDSESGRAHIDEWICEPQSVVISATPNVGYAFTRWSDGNTDNPRTVRLTQDTTLTAEFGLAYSGMCGENLYWEYSSGNLQITGSGIMYDYTKSTMPWLYLRDSIYSVTLPQGITCIGAYAFCGCSSLSSITIPNSVIGELVNIDIAVDSLNPNSVYFVNTERWSNIYVYAWGGTKGGTTWPGEIATKADFTYLGYDIYYFTASPGDYAYCIFNNGQDGGVSSGNQTEDLTWTGGQAYFNDEWQNIQIGPYSYYKVAIGANAFSDCNDLRDITCLAVTPPTCGSNAFNNVPYDATLWCPCEGKEAYQSADGWSRFYDIRRINFPQTTLLTDSEKGRVQIDEWICEPQSVVISATPYEGYVFTRWSDGNTDNPRTVLLTKDTTLTAEFGLAYSGMCGDNLYWEYKNKKLSITGSGEMYDGTPWWLLSDSIYSVSLPNGIKSIGNRAFSGCYNLVSITIPNTVTYIGSRAFEDCIALTSITLPNSLTSIAYRTFSGCTALASVTIPSSVTMIEEYAFEECRKLRDIYCYAATPPTAQTNSFANYNVYVHVPCASLDAYDMDAVFGSFKYVECIGSEDADITDKTVTIVPGNADATFTWPITDGAETYTLVITKDGVTFCTLVFNKQGQLVSIAFKPARQNAPATEGTTPANYAEQTANGFRFTVTNLSEGTAYAYTLTVRDAANSILETYTGEFTTQSDNPMGIHESAGDNTPAGQAEKILQNGQVLILRNGVTYDMMGQQL